MFVNRYVRFTETMIGLPLRKAVPQLWSAMTELAAKDTVAISRQIGDKSVTMAVRDGVQRHHLGSFWSKLSEVLSFAVVNIANRISPKWAKKLGLTFTPRADDISHFITTTHESGHALAAKAVGYRIDAIRTQRVGKGDPHVLFTMPPIKTTQDVLKHIFTLVAGEVSVLGANLSKRLGAADLTVLERAKFQRYGAIGDVNDIRKTLQQAVKDGLIDASWVGRSELKPIVYDSGKPFSRETLAAVDETLTQIPIVHRMRYLFDDLLGKLKPEHYQAFVHDLRLQKRVTTDFGVEYFMGKAFNHERPAQKSLSEWVMSEIERLSQRFKTKAKAA